MVHELGHWLAAHALGGKNIRVRVRPGAWAAAVDADLPSVPRRVAFFLAGPLASLAAGTLVLVFADGWVSLGGLLSVALGVTTLLPWGQSDGKDALALLLSDG